MSSTIIIIPILKRPVVYPPISSGVLNAATADLRAPFQGNSQKSRLRSKRGIKPGSTNQDISRL